MAIQNPYPVGPPFGGPRPVVAAKDLRPRRVWYLVAALLGVVLAGVGVALVVVTVKDTLGSIDTARSFSSGASRRFGFTQGETKAIYVSQTGRGRVECRIPGMRPGAITRPNGTFRISHGSRSWNRVLEVKPSDSGEFTLTCTSELPAEFALGDNPRVGATVGNIGGAIGCFLAAFFSAAAIIAVTAVRRSSHRRRLTAASAVPPQWNPAAPQWGPAPPQWDPASPQQQGPSSSGPPPGPQPGPPA
ncbi:serine/arginine repetitive matrix protein 2 [Streptomyces sp. NPDC005573]|uniref:serine/arginine repetitive matrix protein 2 n=1 Tax=Streptomyces sp. NPDC005573 TaxID=3156890 RepID=UPI0033B6EE88